VVAHRRCVSAKRLHIENVLPLWGTTKWLPLCGNTFSMCFRKAVAHLMHIKDMQVFPRSGCTSYAYQRYASVSAKRLHIFDVLPLWGTEKPLPLCGNTLKMCFREAVAHRRCVSAKRLHIEDVLPLRVAHHMHIYNVQVLPGSGSGCISKMYK
jgi:hypothetical protein